MYISILRDAEAAFPASEYKVAGHFIFLLANYIWHLILKLSYPNLKLWYNTNDETVKAVYGTTMLSSFFGIIQDNFSYK